MLVLGAVREALVQVDMVGSGMTASVAEAIADNMIVVCYSPSYLIF